MESDEFAPVFRCLRYKNIWDEESASSETKQTCDWFRPTPLEDGTHRDPHGVSVRGIGRGAALTAPAWKKASFAARRTAIEIGKPKTSRETSPWAEDELSLPSDLSSNGGSKAMD